MKLKKILILCSLFLSLSIQHAIAQNDSLDLSEYKIKNFKYHQLISNIFFNQNNTLSRNLTFSSLDKLENSRYSANLNSAYFGIRNSELWQKETSVGLLLNGNLTNDVFNASQSDNSSISYNLNIDAQNRKYYEPKEFFEYNFKVRSQLNKSFLNSFSGGMTEKTSQIFSDQFGLLALKTGRGRIDPVSDARHAIFILNDLEKVHRLERSLSPEEIMDFALLINRLKNKRFFDFRHRKIYELEAVDSFLQVKNLVKTTDIRYFSTLNDIWSFGGGPIRYSGHRFSMALFTGYNNFKRSITFFSEAATINSFNLSFGFEHKQEKPFNLFTQNSLSAYGYMSLANGNVKESDNASTRKILFPKINIGLVEKLGYYPNTRTAIEYSLYIHYVKVFDILESPEDPYKFNLNGISTGSEVVFNYYFSPRLRMTARPSFNYKFLKSKTELAQSSNFDINNHLLFLFQQPECDNLDCRFNLESEKRYLFNFNFSLSYSFF